MKDRTVFVPSYDWTECLVNHRNATTAATVTTFLMVTTSWFPVKLLFGVMVVWYLYKANKYTMELRAI